MKLRTNQSGVAHTALIALVAIIAVAGFVGWKVWGNSNKTTPSTAQPKQSTSPDTSQKTSTDTAAKSSDEQVVAVLKTYCNANVDPATKKSMILIVGKAGTSQKQVLYSTNKDFAYVNASCTAEGDTKGSGSAYYLKKVNDTWVFLYRGQMVSEEYSKQFNIPDTTTFN